MNNRLKIICILFAAAYLFVIGNYMVTHIHLNFTATPPENNSEKNEVSKKNETSDAENKDGWSGSAKLDYSTNFHIKPLADGGHKTPLLNRKTGYSIYVESDEVLAVMDTPENQPRWIGIMEKVDLFLHLLVVLIIIYIPFVSFRAIKSISKNEIFESKNIKRIRRIGYSLLICFIAFVASEYISVSTAHEMIELDDYQIIFRLDGSDNAFLLLGLGSLLFAEILKISTSIKEENDLTV